MIKKTKERPSSLKSRYVISKDWEEVIHKELETSSKKQGAHKNIGNFHSNASNCDFWTTSSYQGNWADINMEGFGHYTMPHGVRYEGQLKDGMFHGDGMLIYPNGGKLIGVWDNGKYTGVMYSFDDGTAHAGGGEEWNYCSMPDRRFSTSVKHGFEPARYSNKTDHIPTRVIPKNCLDTEEGFYDLKTHCILDYTVDANGTRNIIKVPSNDEIKWILTHCRKSWDQGAGYRPEFYERWQNLYRRKCNLERRSVDNIHDATEASYEWEKVHEEEQSRLDYGDLLETETDDSEMFVRCFCCDARKSKQNKILGAGDFRNVNTDIYMQFHPGICEACLKLSSKTKEDICDESNEYGKHQLDDCGYQLGDGEHHPLGGVYQLVGGQYQIGDGEFKLQQLSFKPESFSEDNSSHRGIAKRSVDLSKVSNMKSKKKQRHDDRCPKRCLFLLDELLKSRKPKITIKYRECKRK